jgi:hypothetical protein
MRRVALVAVAVLWCGVAQAQSIKGTVIDDATKAPVPGVLITMVGDNGTTIPPGVRTDSAGAFIVHAARAGTWRVRTSRIGFAPVTSPPVRLDVGGLAVLRLRLTTITQPLAAVQIIERRQYNAAELMSTTGFDLRRQRDLGAFLGSDRLNAMGLDGLREVLATQLQPRLIVYNDPIVGDVLRIREGGRLCAPEIYLDGRLLATAPEPAPIIDTSTVSTALDSARAQSAAEAQYSRLAFSQVVALNTLAGLTAQAVHGIEVYRANEVPPTSLGAWFGLTKTSLQTCGTVAVWTKAGAMSVLSNIRPGAITTRPMQVISGTLVNYETGLPAGAGRAVTLLDEHLDEIGRPALTDDRGEFVIRTGRAGGLRLKAGDTTFIISTTPVFTVASNELLIVRLYVSTREPLVAPLGIASRVQPHNIGITSRAGFTYRRERAQAGVFLRDIDLARTRPTSILEALKGVQGVEVSAGQAEPISLREGGRRCRPALYLDGVSAATAVATGVAVERVLGIEVYLQASQVPMPFPNEGCGIIAIWTRAA